jgi:hypothetical protein
VILLAGLVLTATLSPAAAQERPVRLDGLVQWIAADKLMLILDSGPSVAIDLSRTPLEQYRGLTQRDRVIVLGVVSSDNRRVFALSIIGRGSYGESP